MASRGGARAAEGKPKGALPATAAERLLAVDSVTAFLGLLPGPKRAPDARLSAAIVDTVIIRGGKLWKWLYTAPNGSVSERVHVDKEGLHSAFKQQALASASNAGNFELLVRRKDGRLDVLNVNEAVAFLNDIDEELKTTAVIQKYVHPAEGDGSIYRIRMSTTAAPNGSAAAPELTILRQPGHIVPHNHLHREISPSPCSIEATSSALRAAALTAHEYLAHSLRSPLQSLDLDYVMDEKAVPHLLWFQRVEKVPPSAPYTISSALTRGPSASTTTTRASNDANKPTSGGTTNPATGGTLSARSPNRPTSTPNAALLATSAADHADEYTASEALRTQFHSLVERVVGAEGNRGFILLVDTDIGASLQVIAALTREGFAVMLATDGSKALSITRQKEFDCLLLATHLPALSGVEVTRVLRQREAGLAAAARISGGAATGPHLPIVAFTADTAPEDLRRYMECGMDGCVSKPLDTVALLSTMAAAVPRPRAVSVGEYLQQQEAQAGGQQPPLPSPGRGVPEGGALPSLSRRSGGATPSSVAGPSPASGPRRLSTTSSTGQQQQAMVRMNNSPYTSPQDTPFDASSMFGDSAVEVMLPQPRKPAQAQQQPQRATVAPVALRNPAPKGTLSAGAASSPYQHNQAARLGSTKGGAKGPGGRTATAAAAKPVLRALQQQTLTQPGTVVLPAGAAIPGIAPPVSGGTAGRSIAAAGGVAGTLGGMALPSIPVPEDIDGSILGVFQLDAATSMPYCVMGRYVPDSPLFHFVVVPDLFETFEMYQILFRRVIAKLPGLRVLLLNLPGQAFTEWRRDALLNNEYHAGCVQALLSYVGASGTREFDLEGGSAPFYLLGVGNGGAIANYFAVAYHTSHPSLRALIGVNSFAHVDAHLTAVMHDCINVFATSPPSRPDLPVYFYARFLFCPDYLAKVGAPLALNLHTAVHNPITLEGRIALCNGVMSHVDTRGALATLPLPLILVVSSRDGLVKPSHATAIVNARGGEHRSIKRALLERDKAAVVWLRAGHDAFQELRKPLTNLLEQLATGYHEGTDVPFLPLPPDEEAVALGALTGGGSSNSSALVPRGGPGTATARSAGGGALGRSRVPTGAGAAPLADRFLSSVLSSASAAGGASRDALDARGRPMFQLTDAPDGLNFEPEIPAEVTRSAAAAAAAAASSAAGLPSFSGAHAGGPRSKGSSGAQDSKEDMEAALLLDPDVTRFEKRDQVFARARSQASAAAAASAAPGGRRSMVASGAGGGPQYALPEVREYMSWRVRRNRKRLRRIEACATSIQRAWRSYLARTLVMRMRYQRAALQVQRWWRGEVGRALARRVRRELWAATAIQRTWRGFYGRHLTARIREERRAAVMIQRNWKGYRTRKFVGRIRAFRSMAATVIQALWRRFAAQRAVWRLRDERNAAINIQRAFRGHQGRSRAARERDKYLFSKSQAQGIEFGRQMLLEHKLHATKLQSEVSLLTREKLAAEERVEGLLSEISTFEQGVKALERRMVELSRAEAESAGSLDEAARTEMREAKIALDREFSSVLVHIAERREALTDLEAKLKAVESSRVTKREELKDLERKLVVLLEQQQAELASIRMRQERRQENMVEDAISAVTGALRGNDPAAGKRGYSSSGQHGGGLTIGDATAGFGSSSSSNNLQMVLGGGGSGALAVQGRSSSPPGRGRPGSRGTAGAATGRGGTLALVPGAGAGGELVAGGPSQQQLISGGPTPQQRAEAAALMASTETMMKFGFMSMSLTYFSSLNMIKAMRAVGAANTAVATNPAMLGMLAQMGGAPAMAALGGGGAGSEAEAAGPLRLELQLNLWTVADVSRWLDALSLGQYKDAFADAAIDGAFLGELTDDDLRNTLGIEHALHRKKILSAVARLRTAEEERKHARAAVASGGGAFAPPPGFSGAAPAYASEPAPTRGETALGRSRRASLAQRGGLGTATTPGPAAAAGAGSALGRRTSSVAEQMMERNEDVAAARAANRDAGLLQLEELMSWVRHNKGKLVSEALASLVDGRFDHALVKQAYVPDFGTQYVDALYGPAFHVNKTDEKGNTLLTVAAQNGRQKVAALLVRKGANPNHQNVQGNTPLHFAMAYKFHDMAAWIVDPEKGAADDSVVNQFGLSAYDGLGDGR